MWHELLGDTRLYELLLRVDVDLAREAQKGRCPYCGGPLHVSNYPRKPQGEELSEALGDLYAQRLSFSCGEEGCRRRTTPPSVRFLGRRVYLAAIVVLVTGLRHGATGSRAAALGAHMSSRISRQTLSRWVGWWRTTFPATRCWGALRGFFSPAPGSGELPMSLLSLVGSGLATGARLGLMLWHLGLVTTMTGGPSAAVPMDLRGAQKMSFPSKTGVR
jgi:hypothetical protein